MPLPALYELFRTGSTRAVNRTVMYIIHVLSFAVYKAMNLAVVEYEKMQNPSVIDIFNKLIKWKESLSCWYLQMMQTSEASVPRTFLYTMTRIFALVIHLHIVYFDPVPKNITFGDFLLMYYKRLSAAKRQDKAFFDYFLIYSAETVKHTVKKIYTCNGYL